MTSGRPSGFSPYSEHNGEDENKNDNTHGSSEDDASLSEGEYSGSDEDDSGDDPYDVGDSAGSTEDVMFKYASEGQDEQDPPEPDPPAPGQVDAPWLPLSSLLPWWVTALILAVMALVLRTKQVMLSGKAQVPNASPVVTNTAPTCPVPAPSLTLSASPTTDAVLTLPLASVLLTLPSALPTPPVLVPMPTCPAPAPSLTVSASAEPYVVLTLPPAPVLGTLPPAVPNPPVLVAMPSAPTVTSSAAPVLLQINYAKFKAFLILAAVGLLPTLFLVRRLTRSSSDASDDNDDVLDEFFVADDTVLDDDCEIFSRGALREMQFQENGSYETDEDDEEVGWTFKLIVEQTLDAYVEEVSQEQVEKEMEGWIVTVRETMGVSVCSSSGRAVVLVGAGGWTFAAGGKAPLAIAMDESEDEGVVVVAAHIVVVTVVEWEEKLEAYMEEVEAEDDSMELSARTNEVTFIPELEVEEVKQIDFKVEAVEAEEERVPNDSASLSATLIMDLTILQEPPSGKLLQPKPREVEDSDLRAEGVSTPHPYLPSSFVY